LNVQATTPDFSDLIYKKRKGEWLTGPDAILPLRLMFRGSKKKERNRSGMT